MGEWSHGVVGIGHMALHVGVRMVEKDTFVCTSSVQMFEEGTGRENLRSCEV